MKTLPAFLIACAVFSCAGCDVQISGLSTKMIKGSGNVISETREVSDFAGIRLKGSMDVKVTRSDQFKCVVKADDNIVPLIKTEVRDGSLHISSEESFMTRQGIVVLLEMPELTEVTVNGSGEVTATEVAGENVRLEIDGSGDITMTGEAKKVGAKIDGSGSLKLTGLKAEEADVAIHGSGDAAVWASESLMASVNGSGDVRYSGDPETVARKVSGSGEIRKR